MFPTDLPSIWRWKARFHPKFGTLSTVRRPGGGLPCATVLMEIAHRKARIRRTLLTKLCLGFMAHITRRTGFSPVQLAVNSACFIFALPCGALSLHYSKAIQAWSECDRAPALAVECVCR